MALIADVTEVAGAAPGDAALVQLTEPAPDEPAACSGIDAVLLSPAMPVVSTVAERVWVLEPTVRVQVTVTCFPVAPLVTVAVGLAKARYDGPAGRARPVTVAAVERMVALWLVVPRSDGRALLQVTLPTWLIVPMAVPDEHVPLTRTWSWPVFARTRPTAPGWIFLNETAPLLILLLVTALLRSCAAPT